MLRLSSEHRFRYWRAPLPLKMGDNRGQHGGEESVGGCGWSRVENGEVREGIMQTTTTPRIASLEPER